jgi:hypothetical protein
MSTCVSAVCGVELDSFLACKDPGPNIMSTGGMKKQCAHPGTEGLIEATSSRVASSRAVIATGWACPTAHGTGQRQRERQGSESQQQLAAGASLPLGLLLVLTCGQVLPQAVGGVERGGGARFGLCRPRRGEPQYRRALSRYRYARYRCSPPPYVRAVQPPVHRRAMREAALRAPHPQG